jgi:hypothetical protein
MGNHAPHTEIVVDTDCYSGNFEREMTAWVFGVVEEWESAAGNPYLETDPALSWARYDEESYEPGALVTTLHEEFGPSWQQIEETPGWKNDGMGRCSRIVPGEEQGTYGACNSVRWVFGRILTPQELESVRLRLLSFAIERNSRMASSNRDDAVLTIEGIRVFEVVETRTETLKA